MDFETSIRKTFLEEASQLLEENEACFLALETSSNRQDLIISIFRLVHSLKGSAGVAGFSEISDLAHHLESLLSRLKAGEISIDSRVIDLLLGCNDQLNLMVKGLGMDHKAHFDCVKLIERIQTVSQGGPPDAAAELSAGTPAFGIFDGNEEPLMRPSKPVAQPNPSSGTQNESIRISLNRLDRLMNYVGELVILQTVLSQQISHDDSPLLQKTASQLNKITKEIRDISLNLRMVSLKPLFQKLQKLARDVSRGLDKNVSVVIEGDDSELDKNLIEQISDPLIHLVRNAIDHGFETNEERAAAGKTTPGLLTLAAYQSGSHMTVEVKDDGRGLDPARLIRKAIEKGLLKPEQKLTDDEAYQLIFLPGFSTKTEVTDVSGRGVGMDVVKTNVAALRGDIKIISEVGRGTSFQVSIPLSLAITEGMIVCAETDRYVIPLANVHECIHPQTQCVSTVGEKGEVLELRGQSIPLFRLARLLGVQHQPKAPWEGIAIVVRDVQHQPFAVLVDDIIGQQQIVVKSLGDDVSTEPGIVGGAILGDGKAALIIDLNELLTRYKKASSFFSRSEAKAA